MTDQRLTRAEKLKSKREIDLLFSKGKWLSSENLKLIILDAKKFPPEYEVPAAPKIGFSVPKKNFKRAVDRNRGKRLLREAYRHHKGLFAQQFGQQTIAMIFWTGKNLPQNDQEAANQFIRLCNSKK